MQIFAKGLTGKSITLVVSDAATVEIGPRRADGSFRLRVPQSAIDEWVVDVSVK
jgi:hypothetical protein